MSTLTRVFDLACLGRAAVDLYGEQVGCGLEAVSTFARYLGGSPANTAVGASRLGVRAAMITRVGDEPNGAFVRATLAREGVDVSQVGTDPDRLTALVFLAIRGREDFPHTFYRDRCADMALSAEHIDPAFVSRCSALLVSGTHLSQDVPRAACEKAVAAAQAAGTKIILDIDYRPVLWGLAAHKEGAARDGASPEASARLAAILPACDLVVGTEEEIRVAGGSGDTVAALRRLRELSAALIVVKRGALGCVAFAGPIPANLEQGLVVRGFPIEVLNVLGAGDAFMAGLLRGWLRGEPVKRCCTLANACGAIVASRHGCAPAMPTWTELEHFLRAGRDLEHVHHASTRRVVAAPLHVLAFDHRAPLEAIAASAGAGVERIPAFKLLVARAFENVARDRPGYGVLVDERYGADVLARLTGRGFWIARPVEIPGSNPVEFEAGMNVGLAMRTWPAEHVAKCLVYLHPQDRDEDRERQLVRLAALAEACAATGRELLLEVIPPPKLGIEPTTVARALDAIYVYGIRPDWWKLPPNPQEASWSAVGDVIARRDPLCRGVLVLGMEAGPEELRAGFAAAARSARVQGFAVGRSIFAEAAHDWFAGRASDAQVVAAVAARYEEVIAQWTAAASQAAATIEPRRKERA